MKQTINFSQFCDAFRAHDRQDQFSYEGKRALFGYFEQYEEETGEEVELDVIAICCEYAESSLEDVISDYSLDVAIDDLESMSDEDKREAVREWLNNHTMICGETGAGDFVFQQF